jgi:hypothetical protein
VCDFINISLHENRNISMLFVSMVHANIMDLVAMVGELTFAFAVITMILIVSVAFIDHDINIMSTDVVVDDDDVE